MTDFPVDLFSLLPAAVRVDDAAQQGQLKAFLDIASQQANLLKSNLYELWDDFFIETCADWVIPYIGDLVGNTPIYEVEHGRRADVARTIYFRRRKGTLPMLEELARYVTGWPVHALAAFERMAWTQNMNHYRAGAGTVDVRSIDAADTVGSAFDPNAHTADLRPFAPSSGWYNIKKIAFFIWRLKSYQMQLSTPRIGQVENGTPFGYHFSPLGNPTPLFNNPQPELDEVGLAGEINISMAIRPVAFFKSLTDPASPYYGQYYPATPDAHVFASGLSVSWLHGGDRLRVEPDAILCKDLSTWARPPAGKVAIDVARGRLTFAAGEEPAADADLRVHYCYGFSSELGGGPYDRAHQRVPDTITRPDFYGPYLKVSADPADSSTLSAALGLWTPATQDQMVIQVEDSRTYPENVAIHDLPGALLVIQAGNEERLTLRGNVTIGPNAGADAPRIVIIEGLLIEGQVLVGANSGVKQLVLRHCTLVPGGALDVNGQPVDPTAASLVVEAAGNDDLLVRLERCITGPLQIPDSISSLELSDSIVDSPGDDTASPTPLLLSGSLAGPVVFTDPNPSFLLSLGGSDFRKVAPAGPAAADLQAAIRAADPANPAFNQARVVEVKAADTHWAILPGGNASIELQAAPGDLTTLTELSLDLAAGPARLGYGVVSGGLPAAIPARARTLNLVMEPDTPAVTPAEAHTFTLPNGATTLPGLAADLQAALSGLAGASAAFTAALVGLVENSALLVVAGDAGHIPLFKADPSDPGSLTELGMESRRPALAGNTALTLGAPPTSMMCVTVFGASLVQALMLATEVIFTDAVICQRRQTGCVRFSYLPEGSITPRRYRCQPDTALEGIAPADQPRVIRALVPGFTSRRYGAPAYGQLHLDTAQEIRTGAENGAEMGAFNHLMQPQREANLRIRLEEYLPFGLEPGMIYIS